jgi:Flp pilus assembly protein TadB
MKMREFLVDVATIVLALAVGVLALRLLGPVQSFLAQILVFVIGVAYSMTLRTRHRRERRVQAWRESHPGLSDEFLPEQLKGKA